MKKNVVHNLKKAAFGVFASAFLLSAQAQIATTYTFQQSVGSYTPITGGTLLEDYTGDMDESEFLVVTPAFRFDGVTYNQIIVNTNGFITLGTFATGPYFYTPVSSGDPYLAAISAFGTDLDVSENFTGEIRVEQVGNEIVVQWKDVARYAVSFEEISFQIRIDIATGIIKIVYGGNIAAGSSSDYPEVGLRGPDNTFATNVNNRLVLSTTGSWDNSAQGLDETSTCYFEDVDPGTVPTVGTTFTWTPPTDISLTALVNPTSSSACRTTQETLSVQILNSGSTPIDFSLTPATITADVNGPNGLVTIPVVVNTGILAPGATQTVVVTNALDMAAAGTYDFQASVSMSGDGYATNNGFAVTTRQSSTPSITFPSVNPICSGQSVNLNATATSYPFDIVFTNNTPTPIPDNDINGTISTINVTGVNNYTASQVSVLIEDLQHTYVSDLLLVLEAPDGSYSILSAYNGGSGANFTQTLFTSSAVNPIYNGTAPFTGSFLPEDLFTANLTGSANGAWNLYLYDDYSGDVGILNSWSIIFEDAPNPLQTYNWAPGGTLSATNILNPDASPLVTTTYGLTVTDSSGCSFTDSITVNVSPSPAVVAIASADTICSGSPVTLNGSGADTYTWDNSVVDGVAFTPTQTDTYIVTGVDNNTGCTNTDTIEIAVVATPTVTATVNDSTICEGDAVIFSGTGAQSYTWDNGVTDGVSFTPTASGTFVVIGSNGGACSDTASVAIVVNTLPNVTFAFTNDTLCLSALPLTLAGGSPASGAYSGTGVTGNTFQVTNPGTYNVIYTYTDANGCENTADDNLVVSGCLSTEPVEKVEIRLFPNPNNGQFTIDWTGTEQGNLRIYNAMGQVVYTSLLNPGNTTLQLDVPAGMYTVECGNGLHITRQQVIIQ